MSDRAKALVSLARSIYEVSSIADCFHFKYCINKLLSLSLSAKLRSCKLSLEKATGNCVQEAQTYAQVQFYTDLYVESMANISHILHPFTKGNQLNTGEKAREMIKDELSKIAGVINDCEINDKYGLFTKAQNQVEDVIAVIPLWHQIVADEVKQMGLCGEQQQHFKDILVTEYWQQAIKKTKYAPTRDRLRKELLKCETPIKTEDTHRLTQKAIDLCRKFQRASSQVEGRNGHLSLNNHNQRGFNQNRLKALTVVHNYDTKGIDGKTPAQRLFGHEVKFEPLIEYIINNFGDLPMPRSRKVKNC